MRFTGAEPFWGGEVAGGTLSYSTPETPDGETIAVERFAGRGGLSFNGTLGEQAFEMMVTPLECSDGMSDRTYPFTVTLQIGGGDAQRLRVDRATAVRGAGASVMQPSLFIPHGGGPCFFMPDPRGTWTRMEAYLRGLPASPPERPRAILVISPGHWEEQSFAFGAAQRPGLIYDYYGFPPETYRLTWPAPGAPWLPNRAPS